MSRERFLRAATWHGGLDEANALLAVEPALERDSIFTAAVLGDDEAVRDFLKGDPALAASTAAPYGATALVYLCLSKYLRLDSSRAPAFLRAAKALLDAGADPNAGFHSSDDVPEWETALYGAAGVIRNPELTRLLLERGADPNDGETPYHAPETFDNTTLKILVESGRLTAASLATMLLRKTDWHDYHGIRWLLERGVNPDVMTQWGKTALHNAILSDNGIAIIELLLEHGANPLAIATRPERGSTRQGRRTAVEMAARRGRGDALDAFGRRGFPVGLQALERLLAACARADENAARSIAADDEHALEQLRADGACHLVWFAGNDNVDGVRLLLDLGVPVDARFADGEGYFDIAPDSLAIHAAAWRASHDTVRLLIDRVSPVEARDGKGRTPLMLAVRACVDSYWTRLRSPRSVQALLDAGATPEGVMFPSGYADIDDLLRPFVSASARPPRQP